MRADDVHADDLARVLVSLSAVSGDFDAASLATSADQDLSLDRNRIAERLRGRGGFFNSGRVAAFGNRQAVTREQFFSLIFE